MIEVEFDASTTNHTETLMTKTNMNLSELMAKHDQGDLLRSIAQAVLQLMMEADVDGLIHCPSGHCEAMSREGALDGMNGPTGARRGVTGTATARSTPVLER